MMEGDYTRRMLQTIAAIAAAVMVVAALFAARQALTLIYISALIAMGFSPIVRVLERPRRVPRWLAILVIYLAIVAVLVLLALLIIPPLMAQAAALWAKLPVEFNRFQSFLIQHKLMVHRVTLEEAVQNAPSGAGGNAVGTVLVAISSVIGGMFELITILILSFYFLVEAQAMFDYLIRFVPAGRLMGVPYVYVIALIAAIGETIPIIGPVIGGITAVAVALSVSTRLALMVAAYFFVLHQLEANVLVPKIMERRVGVSPVAVIIALLIGGELWGLIGAILAIPTAAILAVIVEEIAAGQAIRLQRVR